MGHAQRVRALTKSSVYEPRGSTRLRSNGKSMDLMGLPHNSQRYSKFHRAHYLRGNYYLLSSIAIIWPATDLSDTSAYSTLALKPSISVQGLRSLFGVKFVTVNAIWEKLLRYTETAGALPAGALPPGSTFSVIVVG